jgi:hypothetical protein
MPPIHDHYELALCPVLLHVASVAIIENAWGAAYHWISYGCIQKHQQHRDKHQG